MLAWCLGVTAAVVVAMVGVAVGRRSGDAVSGTVLLLAPVAVLALVLGIEVLAGPSRRRRAVADAIDALHRSQAEANLLRQRFTAAFDHGPTPALVLDEGGVVLEVNGAFLTAAGRSATSVIGRSLPSVIDDAGGAVARALSRLGPSFDQISVNASLGDGSCVLQGEVLHGAVLHGELRLAPGGAGAPVLAHWIDTTSARRARDLLDRQTDILESITAGDPLPSVLERVIDLAVTHLDAVAAAIHLTSSTGTLEHAAGLATAPADVLQALGQCAADAGAGPFGPVAHHGQALLVGDVETDPLWSGHRQAARRLGCRTCWSLPLVTQGDRRVVGVLSVLWGQRRVPDEKHRATGTLAAHLAALAVERHDSETGPATRALTDGLTGLASRGLFVDRVTNAMARAERRETTTAVIVVELDRFTAVNETLGRGVGDSVLGEIADRLKRAIRCGDSVARLDGARFAVLCEEIDGRQSLDAVAERLAQSARDPVALEIGDVTVTASVGSAIDDSPGGEPRERTERLLREAESAARIATRNGGDARVLFDSAMREREAARVSREHELRRALANNEVWVAYQPTIQVSTGRLSGVEALARWNHPDHGAVAPDKFIPVAEDSGLIHPLGEHVLMTALTDVAAWRRLRGGRHLTVSVNVSAHQLTHPDLPDRVRRALGAVNVDPSALRLEITEAILLSDSDLFLSRLEALCDLGVGVALDDFATGWDRLAHLRRLPVQVLKIDRSMASGIDDDPDERAVVTAVVELAHTLQLEVVAKGVETAAQLRSALEIGCDQVQGFYFSPPEPAAAIPGLLGRTFAAVHAAVGV